jgi:hypothetical protein
MVIITTLITPPLLKWKFGGTAKATPIPASKKGQKTIPVA